MQAYEERSKEFFMEREEKKKLEVNIKKIILINTRNKYIIFFIKNFTNFLNKKK